MKKIALVAVVFSMLAGLSACGGSSACDDLKTKETDCCNKITDATAKKACTDQVDAAFKVYEAAGGDADAACSAASTAFTCTIM